MVRWTDADDAAGAQHAPGQLELAHKLTHALAISDVEQRWSERVVAPLLERLRPVGRYEPVNL